MNSESNLTSHLTYEQLLDYLERRLSPDDVRHVESHLATECSVCQADLNWLDKTVKLMASNIWIAPPAHLNNSVYRMFRENQPKMGPTFSLDSWLRNLWPQPRPVAIAFVATLVLVIALGLLFRSQLQPSMSQEVAVAAAEGTVLALPPDSEAWQPLTEDLALDAGTQVQTGDESSVVLTFPDDSRTVAAPNTELEIVRMSSLPSGSRGVIVMSQTLGQTLNVVQSSDSVNSRFEIRTPAARVVVRGTEFTVIVDELGVTDVFVAEGVVEVIAMGITVSLNAGEATTVIPGQEPDPPATRTSPPTTIPTAADTPEPSSDPTDGTDEGNTREPLESATPTPQSSPGASSPTPTPTSSRSPTATPPSGGNGGGEPTQTPPPPPPTNTSPPPSPTMPPPADTPTPEGSKVPPGLTKTPQPPGQTRTPQAGSNNSKVKK